MFLRLGLWNCWRRYFSMRAITPPLPYLSKHRNYMLVQFPHACCPLACWLVLGMAGIPQAGKLNAATPLLLHHAYASAGPALPSVLCPATWAGRPSANAFASGIKQYLVDHHNTPASGASTCCTTSQQMQLDTAFPVYSE